MSKNTIYTVKFRSSRGTLRDIASINSEGLTEDAVLKEANAAIYAFCKEHNYKIPYVRMWNADGKTIFDVGSHTEFFHLIPEVNYGSLHHETDESATQPA